MVINNNSKIVYNLVLTKRNHTGKENFSKFRLHFPFSIIFWFFYPLSHWSQKKKNSWCTFLKITNHGTTHKNYTQKIFTSKMMRILPLARKSACHRYWFIKLQIQNLFNKTIYTFNVIEYIFNMASTIYREMKISNILKQNL